MSTRGFGFDSAIEVTSSVAALWRLWRDPDEARREASERRAMQIIGVCFLLLAAYVTLCAIGALSRRKGPGALNGWLRPVPDPVVATRLMLETLVFWPFTATAIRPRNRSIRE